MNCIVFVFALVCQSGGQDMTESLFQVTEERLDEFSHSLAELEDIGKRLHTLGDPRVKRDGEDTKHYFDRIHEIYTQRARGILLLQMEYEEALTTMYELEADLDFYLWELSNEHEGFAARQKAKVDRKNEARQRSLRLRHEETVVRKLLYQTAKSEHDRLAAKAERTWREQQQLAILAGDIQACESAKDAIVTDQLTLEQKYRNNSIPELREILRQLEVRVEAAKFEFTYLKFELEPQDTRDIVDLLGERFGKILEEAREVVKQSKDLEKRAASVAVLARETREQLRELRLTRGLISRNKKLMEFRAGEARRMEALSVISGLPQPPAAGSAEATKADEEQAAKMWESLLGADEN